MLFSDDDDDDDDDCVTVFYDVAADWPGVIRTKKLKLGNCVRLQVKFVK